MTTNTDLSFGEWMPDMPDIANPGVTLAQNVIPHVGGYRQFSALATNSSALTTAAIGAASFSDDSGNTESYAGITQKLYRLQDATWADKSGATYATGNEGYWEFLKWGQGVIATNFADPVQYKTMGAGTNFADLSGSPPKAYHIGAVQNIVVLGNINDGTHYADTIAWSGFNAETNWGNPNPATQSDRQKLAGDGGDVQAILGGDVGVIFTERSIWTMEYVGPPLIFQLKEVSVGVGTPAPRTCVRHGNSVFFYGEDGFYRYDIGRGLTQIGHSKVNLWFADRVSKDNYHKITAAIDVPNSKVAWGYPTGGGNPDEILFYDWQTDQWSYAEQDHEVLFLGRAQGVTLAGLDAYGNLDTLTLSFDADAWKGGALALYGFFTDHKSGVFNGAAKTARIETQELASPDGQKLLLNEVRPLVQGVGTGTNTVYLGTRNVLDENYAFGSGVTANAIGSHPVRSSARYHRIRCDIAGGFQRAIGVRVNAIPNGER